MNNNGSHILVCLLIQAKEIEMEHLQRQFAEKDRLIQDARASEAEAKVSHIAMHVTSPSII